MRPILRCLLTEPGTFRLHALDFPGSKGFFKEEQIITPTDDSPPKRALATLKPVSGRVTSTRAAAEGLKTVCFIPLVNHGRALGYMSLARVTRRRIHPGGCRIPQPGCGTDRYRHRKRVGIRRDLRTERQTRAREALSRRRNPQRDGFRADRGEQPGAQARPATGRDGRPKRFHGFAFGRNRNRKRTNRPRDSRPQPAQASEPL